MLDSIWIGNMCAKDVFRILWKVVHRKNSFILGGGGGEGAEEMNETKRDFGGPGCILRLRMKSWINWRESMKLGASPVSWTKHLRGEIAQNLK